jgi:two-component system, cell cycle sensor histidine kinase and response regulator CckA
MEPARIMVVEDDRIVARDIQGRLEGLDYNVPSVVSTGEQAVVEARKNRPDLVLMDIRLPGQCDGIEAARRIRQSDRIPVVYLTAYSDEETLSRASSTEAYGYVLKPCETRRLQAAIQIALRKHRSEEPVYRERKLLRQVFKHLPMALLTVDPDSKILSCNEAATELLHCRRDGLVGKDAEEIVRLEHRDGRPVELPIGRVFSTGQRALRVVPLRLVRGDGRGVEVEFCAVPVKSPTSKETIAVAILLEDVSGRDTSDDQIIQAESLRMLSQVTSGIAHHYNNLLTVIEGYSRLLRRGWDSGEELQESLGRIISAAERATHLTRQLMHFSREQKGRPLRMSVHESLRETVEMVRPMLSAAIRLSLDLEAETGWVSADPGHLREVWAQLLLNSRDAMPDGGRITVSTRERSSARSDDPGWVQVRVEDQGVGMDAETRHRAFDPFFTTKEVGQGVGLGLATVFCNVQNAGGVVTIESAPLQGTTVTVCLPLASSQAETVEAERDLAPPAQPSATSRAEILVVDDEDSVLHLASRVLQPEQLAVVTCDSAMEAIERLKAEPDRFDAALLDVVMPSMDGVALAEALREIRPDLAIMFTSGCDATSVLERVESFGSSIILPKPWRPEALLVAIRRTLGWEKGVNPED